MNIDLILYILVAMMFWDFTIHVIDKRDRKYGLSGQLDRTWVKKLKSSKSFLSYYYPHFWGKKPVSYEQGQKRYDYFWLTYWGTATVLLIIYIIFK